MNSRTRRPLIRLPARSYDTLKALSIRTKRPMTDLLADALKRYEHDRFLAEANAQYARLSPRQHREMADELAVWDGTLMDGLEDEDWEEERRAGLTPKPASRRRVVVRPGPRSRP